MHLPSYHVLETADDYSEYKFVSIGPKGEIPKAVVFELMFADENIYNVALLDVLPQGASDTNVSNNGDMRVILATATQILINYTGAFPERKIFFKGSDEEGKRMAVYHRAIREYYSVLQDTFIIEGFVDENVKELFNPLNSYYAFLVKRK